MIDSASCFASRCLRPNTFVGLLVFGIALAVSNHAVGIQNETGLKQGTDASAGESTPNPTASAIDQLNLMNARPTIAPKAIQPKYQNNIPSTLNTSEMVNMFGSNEADETNVVKLKSTIEQFAAAKSLPLHQARMEALTFLGMAPKIRTQRAPGEKPSYEHLGDDQFLVTAPKSFFRSLHGLKRCLELGKRQVAVRCQVITIDQSQAQRLSAFVDLGNSTINCGVLPKLPSLADKEIGEDTYSQPSITTLTTVRENRPVVTGKISAQNMTKLNRFLESSEKASVSFSPTVVMYPDQVGQVADVSARPFVVALSQTRKNAVGESFTQPVVQAIEDGTTIQVRATPIENEIQLSSILTISQVVDVETFNFTSGIAAHQRAIQVPKQRIQQVNLDVTLENNSAILIDPNFTETAASRSKGQKHFSNQSTKTIFLLHAVTMEVDSERMAKHVKNGKKNATSIR